MRPLSFVQRHPNMNLKPAPIAKRFLALAAVATAVAAPTAAHSADYRGFASAGPLGVILFQECKGRVPSARLVNVEDETAESALAAGIDDVRRVMLDSSRPLYVEFDGITAGAVVKARRFQRAVGTVESCADALKDVPAGTRLWATGSDPAWLLIATAEGARFQRPGEKPVRFSPAPFAAPVKPASARIIDAWSAQDGGTIRIEITQQMCSDGSSETAYGAHVMLRYGSRSYEGCAARF
jgi:uncharacterized membrane protein